jgi:two-component system response regulator MtrA
MERAAGSILIVEDDSAACDGLAQLVKGAGFRVRTASDGVAALEALDREPTDVILLDLWMPRMDGLQVLCELKSRASRPKVLVMTADDTPETVLLTLRQDAYKFVSKPIHPPALMKLLHDTVGAPTHVPSVVVLSARPGWLELLVPCAREVADRIEGYVAGLEADLTDDVRASVGMVFRELLLDAMEGDGHCDPNRRVRIAFLRSRRMLLYRIADAGYGFREGDMPTGVTHRTGVTVANDRDRNHGLLRPGLLVARELADELLVNEARDEVVFVKYLD